LGVVDHRLKLRKFSTLQVSTWIYDVLGWASKILRCSLTFTRIGPRMLRLGVLYPCKNSWRQRIPNGWEWKGHYITWRLGSMFRFRYVSFLFCISRFFFPQVLCHNLCFLMYSKLFLVVVGLWEWWPE
jgi:hypothetical protein